MSHLSNLFRRRGMERGLRPGQLARLLGYKNIAKGANRIQSFENGGKARPDLLGNLAEALEIRPETPCEPYAVIGGRPVQFDLGGGLGLRPIDEPPG